MRVHRNPVDELLFDALCMNYWGDELGARALLMRITERVLDRDVQTETPTPPPTRNAVEGTSFPPGDDIDAPEQAGDDIDWEDAAGADLYPWDGWQFNGSKRT